MRVRRRAPSSPRRARSSPAADEPLQSERTRPAPLSPYGAAKAFGLHAVQAFRARYGLHASAGILFNHESPRRPPHFVTRKITRAAAAISLGLEDHVTLGNLDARRDWGFAGDYTRAMQLMVRAEERGRLRRRHRRGAHAFANSSRPRSASSGSTGRSTSATTSRSRGAPPTPEGARRRRDEGARAARLEARGRLRRTGAAHGRGRRQATRRARRAVGVGRALVGTLAAAGARARGRLPRARGLERRPARAVRLLGRRRLHRRRRQARGRGRRSSGRTTSSARRAGRSSTTSRSSPATTSSWRSCVRSGWSCATRSSPSTSSSCSTFPLAALTAFLVLRRLGVGPPGAFAASVLFALLPYHFLRGEDHLFLAAYWAVPLGCFLVLSVLADTPLVTPLRSRRALAIARRLRDRRLGRGRTTPPSR